MRRPNPTGWLHRIGESCTHSSHHTLDDSNPTMSTGYTHVAIPIAIGPLWRIHQSTQNAAVRELPQPIGQDTWLPRPTCTSMTDCKTHHGRNAGQPATPFRPLKKEPSPIYHRPLLRKMRKAGCVQCRNSQPATLPQSISPPSCKALERVSLVKRFTPEVLDISALRPSLLTSLCPQIYISRFRGPS